MHPVASDAVAELRLELIILKLEYRQGMSCGHDVDKWFNHRDVNAGRSKHIFDSPEPFLVGKLQGLNNDFTPAAIYQRATEC